MMKRAFTVIVAAAALALSCAGGAKNPYQNPDNVKIQEAVSLSNMKGTLKAGAFYTCSVSVFLPGLVDTMVVLVSHDGADSVLYHLAVGDSPLVVFPYSPGDTGGYRMQVILVKVDGKKDSLPAPRQFMVFDFTPKVTPVAATYRAYLGDSVTVRFHVTARDSNLLACITRISLDPDTILSQRVIKDYGLSRVCDDTVSRTFKGRLLRERLKSPLICYAQACDRGDVYSEEVSCTVFVYDTVRPKLTLLAPHASLHDSIVKLPDSIVVRAFDLSAVDSVKANGSKMALFSDTVLVFAKQIIATLSPGINKDTIIAWDRVGNTDTLVLDLAYAGPQTHPPKIKPLDCSIREGGRFDTLFLDTCVQVTDPAFADSPSYRSSLSWIITDSAGNLVPSYNVTTRKLVIPVKNDSEWVDTFNFNIKVVDKNGLSDSRVATFRIDEVPDPPAITMKNMAKPAGTPFDTLWLDTCVRDPDNAASALQWSWTKGKVFKIDSLFSSRFDRLGKAPGSINPISFKVFSRHVAVVPIDTVKAGGNSWTGVDTLQFSVRDPSGLSQKRLILFEKYGKIGRTVIDTAFIKIP